MGQTTRAYPFLPEGATVRSVSELTEDVKQTLERGLAFVWVEGEIVDVGLPPSGHVYVTLRDARANLKCYMSRTQALRLPAGFVPKVGTEVLAGGRIGVYTARGEYQLVVERMHPKGVGAAELALRQLREKLQGLGYFERKRKKTPPRFPRSICLITSPKGAVVHDLIEILGRRWPATKIAVRPSRVQGDGAAEEIALAIRQVNRWKANRFVNVDVLVIARGGGGGEDLAAFNQEIVAEAIFSSRIPIVSAVGHEIDFTIADMVADVRASTPSHAAEMCVPDRFEVFDCVQTHDEQMRGSMRRICERLRHRLDAVAERRVLLRPTDRLRDMERRVDDWAERLDRGGRGRIERARRDLESAAACLESLSPLNVLARGYSLTRTEMTQTLVRSADQVQAGDRLVTTVHGGRILSRVESTEPQRQP